jgi:hypothetical protein
MKDDIIYKHALTFSHQELAGMYAIISKREVEYLKEIKILRLSLQSHGEIVDMNFELREQLKELKGHNNTIFNAAYEAGALEQSKGACFHCEDVALMNIKLKEENARLREALEFYADGASWQAFNLGDEIPMRSDRESEYSVCGMRARQALLKTEEA